MKDKQVLFIRERQPGGKLGDPVPAFGHGKTESQKLQDAEREIRQLNATVSQLTEMMLTMGGA